ncbi:hypothetical protein GXN76_11885 [Kroppenstedtia pulmonis]|uniref:Head fiber protein n=1 Tax=Kroppenstedtia pulmonis TaxID=1380685 RepID=A0A7D4C7R5_9BACL|nr:head fiber protein [Kroppenstedtia pulmonis]QKG85096.1 hypothetical protein GXN76_11885 [Kroppenstedtia pulmonis]
MAKKADASHTHGLNDVSGLQDALDGKAESDHTHSGYAPTNHTHDISDVSDLQTALDGKASASHNHDGVYQPAGNYANESHTHPISEITNLQTQLNSKLTATQAGAQADSTATEIGGLVDDFNALLTKLRAAGIIAE